MVSVCMATKNGEQYIKGQLDSILSQLQPGDELVISDDCSQDRTIEIIQSYQGNQIVLTQRPEETGIIRNFETSLQLSKGDLIFLADQDDVWLPNKLEVMIHHLQQYDLVVCDCLLVDKYLQDSSGSFFTLNKSGKGMIKNMLKNSYMGCCMGFKRSLLNRSMPFPKDIPGHDSWIGLMAELYFKVYFIPEILVYHRRHGNNASTTGQASSSSLYKKIKDRYSIIKNLFLHKTYAR